MKRIPDKSVDCIVTDPPYLYLKHKLDKAFDEELVFDEWNRIVKDDGFILFFGRGESFYRWNYMLNQMGWKFKEEVVWSKNTASSPFSKIGRTHETIAILSKDGKVRKSHVPYLERRAFDVEAIKRDVRRLTIALDKPEVMKDINHFLKNGETVFRPTTNKFEITGVKPGSADRRVSIVASMERGFVEQDVIQVSREHYTFKHPTQKPVRLMERLINIISDEGDMILDPFIGSGTTAVACQNLNRNFIGFELDKEYYDIATERVKADRVDEGSRALGNR